jgi:hypothetical protein
MPDFMALAQEAGGLNVAPFATQVGSGDTVKMSVELYNASGVTGVPGTVTWTLPPGWKSSPAKWEHGKIAKDASLKQTITFTAPAGMTYEKASIVFSDSRFKWHREIVLTTCPDGRTITDGESTKGWTVTDGAAVVMDSGMVTIHPKQALTEVDNASLN